MHVGEFVDQLMKPKPFSLLNHFTVPLCHACFLALNVRGKGLGSDPWSWYSRLLGPTRHKKAPVSPLDGPRRVQVGRRV